MNHLSTLARVTTPLAMVVFLTHELSRSLPVTGLWYAVMLVGSAGTAVGIEVVGILAGHTLEGFWRLGDTWRGLLSFALLLVYTLAAVYVLRANAVLTVVPIVAAIVYILAALSDGLTTAVKQQERKTAVQVNYELRDRQAEADHKRMMQLEQLRLKHEEKMARIAAIPAPQNFVESQPTAQPAMLYECSCGRVFDKAQSYSAHTRHCDTHRQFSANGKVNHVPQTP